MFNRILSLTDGSPLAESARQYAVSLARAFGSEIVGLFVIDVRLVEGPMLRTLGPLWGDVPYTTSQGEVYQSLERRGREILQSLESRCRAEGIPTSSTLSCGVVHEEIVQEAKRVDLVVIGKRGEHAAFGRDPLGSTADRVIRRCVKPVLVAPERLSPMERLLVPYDGGEHAVHALEVAAAYAERKPCALQLLTAHEDEARAREILRAGCDFLGGHNLRFESSVASGHPAAAIVSEVEARGIDCVIMGAFGQHRLREVILGSTTEDVLSQTAIPVLVCH